MAAYAPSPRDDTADAAFTDSWVDVDVDLGVRDAGPDASGVISGLQVVDIFSGVAQVYPGEADISVYVTVRNTLRQAIELTSITIVVEAERQYQTRFSLTFPAGLQPIEPGARAELPVQLSVGNGAPSGALTVSADVGAVLADTRQAVGLMPGRPTLTWWLVRPTLWLVTTAEDELDLDPVSPTVEEAQQGSGLSLREAIWLANLATPDMRVPVIRFSPEIEVTDEQRLFRLNRGALPPLRTDGTQIDGTGQGVRVVARDMTYQVDGDGLIVVADDVTIRGIAWEQFSDDTLNRVAIRADQVYGLHIVDNVFERNGTDVVSGAQVVLRSGSNHAVVDCEFTEGPRDGLLVTGADEVLVRRNRFLNSGDDGLSLIDGRGHVIVGNQIIDGTGTASGGMHAGIELEDVTAARIEDNQIEGMPYGVKVVSSNCSELGIVSNVLRNTVKDVSVQTGARAVSISRNQFNGQLDGPIDLERGANDGVDAPWAVSYDGSRLSGQTSETNGKVELYLRETADTIVPPATQVMYRFLAATVVSDESWSFATDQPPERLYVLFTNSDGCSSELRAAVQTY